MSVDLMLGGTEDEIEHVKEQVTERLREQLGDEQTLYIQSLGGEGVNGIPDRLMNDNEMECDDCGDELEKKDMLYQFLFKWGTRQDELTQVTKYEMCRNCHMKWRVKDAI